MMSKIQKLGLLGIVTLGVPTVASAATLLNPTGTVALGVNPEGHLNAPDPYGYAINAGILGVTSIGLGDATSPGCTCEGWGVSASGVSAFANDAVDGIVNITLDSFVHDDAGAPGGTFATSVVHATSLPDLQVTQHYAAAAAAGPGALLFKNTVTIKNTGAGVLDDPRYVRVMDWDVPPTEFFEFVTIAGTATTAALEESDNNGFSSANPLAPVFSFGFNTVDFVDVGPADHGAYFRFLFADLGPGEERTFEIFYGAAPDEAGALASLGAVGAEIFSLGQSTLPGDVPNNDGTTFMFGFKGVGGIIILPPPGVPDGGATLGLLGLSLLGLVGFKRFWLKA
jgi:type IV pilus assembly protein PilY1